MAVRTADRSFSVILFAAQSRIFVFLLQVFFNYLIPDHNADVFMPEQPKNGSLPNLAASFLLDGLTNRWDAIYFMHVAEHSYTYENTLVFFPLFPLLIKLLSYTIFYPLTYILAYRNVLNVAAVALNFVCFLSSTCIFYKLGCKVLGQEYIAYKAALLFCVNPASIFFSAAYSETLFSLLTFAGLLKLQEGSYLKSSILFALGTATRMNGIVNAGFVIYSFVLYWHRKYTTDKNVDDFSFVLVVKRQFGFAIKEFAVLGIELISLLFWICVICSLALSHQTMCYLMFCDDMRFDFKKWIPQHLVDYGKKRGYTMPGYGVVPKWCHAHPPISYSSIQDNHWNVGLFRYYEIKQLPNFLLALPMIFICLSLFVSYLRTRPMYCMFLGLVPKCMRDDEQKKKKRPNLKSKSQIIYCHKEKCYVYVVHLLFLTIFATFFMHIQVITRLICSSSPIFYWFIAERCVTSEDRYVMKLLSRENIKKEKRSKRDEQNVTDSESDNRDSSTVSDGRKEKLIEDKPEKFDNLGSSKLAKDLTLVGECISDSEKTTRLRISRTDGNRQCEADTEECENNDKEDSNDVECLVSEIIKESDVIDWNGGWFNKFVSVYFHLYLFVGVAAFSNFFPWT